MTRPGLLACLALAPALTALHAAESPAPAPAPAAAPAEGAAAPAEGAAAPAEGAAAPAPSAAEAPAKAPASAEAEDESKRAAEALAGFLEAHNLIAGLVLVLAGIMPLFFGWRLIRFLYFVMGAVVGGGLVLAFTVLSALPPVAVVLLTLGGGALWGFLMSYLYHVQVALSGGLFLAAAFALPVLLLGQPGIACALGLMGLAVGLILGWKAAPLLGILQTALFGALLVGGGGCLVLLKGPQAVALGGGAALGLVGLVAGIAYQLRCERQRRGARRPGARRPARRIAPVRAPAAGPPPPPPPPPPAAGLPPPAAGPGPQAGGEAPRPGTEVLP